MKFNLDAPQFQTSKAGETIATPKMGAVTKQMQKMPESVAKAFVELLCKHGGIYDIMDENLIDAKIQRLSKTNAKTAGILQANKTAAMKKAGQLFKHLSDRLGGDRKYVIDSSLISHISFPYEGRTYSRLGDVNDNEKIPAFMTFIGQFIDHDLTLNPINLFDDQMSVTSDASACLDLDSVYRRNSMVSHTQPGTDVPSPDNPNFLIFEKNGTFRLKPLTGQLNAYDLFRDSPDTDPSGKPFIFDLRNDENKIILQIHILIMRLHNKLAKLFPPPDQNDNQSIIDFINKVKKEVIKTWQSFVWNGYLPTVVSKEPLDWVLQEIEKPDFGGLKHKPEADGTLRMPHEFAIGFRMGHSQLRDKYKLNPAYDSIPLFDNKNAVPDDLRGGEKLKSKHIIDWPFFSSSHLLSNKIDTKITAVVFDLPQSTIPDMVKQVGNLPQRNLIRSSQVHLAAAEDLIELYGLQNKKLTDAQIESDPEKQKLFQLGEDGKYKPGNLFRTPLWYYILKEAEYVNCGGQLGPLGGRIIAEVIIGGIFHSENSFRKDTHWIPMIPKASGEARTDNDDDRKIAFEDIVACVTEKQAEAKA